MFNFLYPLSLSPLWFDPSLHSSCPPLPPDRFIQLGRLTKNSWVDACAEHFVASKKMMRARFIQLCLVKEIPSSCWEIQYTFFEIWKWIVLDVCECVRVSTMVTIMRRFWKFERGMRVAKLEENHSSTSNTHTYTPITLIFNFYLPRKISYPWILTSLLFWNHFHCHFHFHYISIFPCSHIFCCRHLSRPLLVKWWIRRGCLPLLPGMEGRWVLNTTQWMRG